MSQVYLKLAEIAQKSKTNAAGLPAQDDVKDFWSGIGFELGGKRYVSPVPEIAEIMPVPRFTQVPGVQDWVRGVANVRGRLLPIMDLSVFMFKQLSKQQAKRRRVLIVDHEELYSGIVVDEVFGMQYFDLGDYQEHITGTVDESVKPFLSGQYIKDGSVWMVFSPFSLAQDPRFLKAAS